MKISCNQNILSQAINIVIKATPSKSTNPVLECILLNANNDIITLIGNNLELGIKKEIEGLIIENGTITLDAKLFYEIIRKMPPGEIAITSINESQVTIVNEKSKFTLQALDYRQFPDLPIVPLEQSFTIMQHDLKDMIKQTIFSVAQDESRPVMTGEKFELENGNLNVVAVDGFRIAFRTLVINNKNLKLEKVIPAKTLIEVAKILQNPNDNNLEINICFSDNHVLFDLVHTVVISRLLEGEFLKYKDIFSNDVETKILVKRIELLMGIERAALMSKESYKNPVKFSISENKFTITSNTEIGNSIEEVDVELTGIPIKIAFNPKYLIDALKNIDDEKIYINFLSKTAPAIIKSTTGEQYKYLILPIRAHD
ncbi:DNA polymerase III subunit beta [Candidatus Epulonipiscioides gigas]|nr:DNA polymerase III subunit beta [Epulopiscium sp. SCG-C07WGA-EpuloA2]